MQYLDLLRAPHRRERDPDLFDEEVRSAVLQFQEVYHHTRHDGLVGPGTRRLIVSTLLQKHGASLFLRLERPERIPLVFISYAWKDSKKVNKLDQWLRDHGVRILRDQTDFAAGEGISDNIRKAVAISDKVVAVYSANSTGREWPSFEAFVAGELEEALGHKLLIYVRLDDTNIPQKASDRLYIDARHQPLKTVGARLLHAILGEGMPAVRYEYDEDKPL